MRAANVEGRIFDRTHLQVMSRRRLERWCKGSGLAIERWFDRYEDFHWRGRVGRICDRLTLRLLAKDREPSRQALDREAEQVANAVDGAAAQARIDELQRPRAEQPAHVHALPERLKHAVAITSDDQHEFATVAQAEGVSRSVARRRFRVVEVSEATPSVPPLGRATPEASRRTGGWLKGLDEAARPAVKQGPADAIAWAKNRS